jgi:hypothetical protein
MADIVTTVLEKPKRTLIGVLLLLAAYIGYSFWVQSDLPKQMPLVIGRQLNMELMAEAATRDLHVSQPNGQPTAGESRKFEEEQQAIEQLQIVSLTKRGFGGRVVVKATYCLGGKSPPEGEETRYYRLKFSWLTGWRFPYRVQEKDYRLAWF